MKSCGKFLFVLGSTALALSASAVSSDNPYKVIFDRNAFKLNPPNPPPKVEPVQEAPPPNVELTGFSQVGDEKKAWFMILPSKPDPGQQPQYVSLRVGERTAISGGSLELKELNDLREETRVIISGKEASYSLKHGTGSKIPLPGMQPIPGGAVPPPPVYVPNNSPRTPTASVPQFSPLANPSVGSARSSVIAGTSSSVVAGQSEPAAFRGSAIPVPQSNVATPQVNALTMQADGTVRVPARTLRLPGATQNGVIATPPQKPMTAEESIIAVEVNRELTKDAVARKELPPLPPTPLTEK